jgi:glycosyltransferase A (GT-A) superfamily protein (DUF2064 family)
MGYEKVLIVGSDIFELEQKDIENAFTVLDTTETVLGPATDGGYYLLGMKAPNAKIFQNKNWGTNTVLEETLADLNPTKYVLLEARNDVDYFEDIKEIDAFQQFLPPYLDKNFL